MIGKLPTSLNVGGVDYDIRSDYRVCLNIFQAYNDPDLTEYELAIVVLKCLYKDFDSIPEEHITEAYEKAVWFLDCGGDINADEKKVSHPTLYDWEQDEQVIFSAVNKVAGQEVRAVEYMHFWTFMGLFNEIGEGTFQTLTSIRYKLAYHQKLEKWERDYYRKNASTVKLKRKYSESEKKDLDAIEKLLKGV